MEQLKFKVEEYHRGEWLPLEGKNEKGEKTGTKIVKTTQEIADVMNIDSAKTKIRYVLLEEKSEKGFEIKDLYKMNKSEQEEKAAELGVEFTQDHSNQSKRADFLKSVIESETK